MFQFTELTHEPMHTIRYQNLVLWFQLCNPYLAYLGYQNSERKRQEKKKDKRNHELLIGPSAGGNIPRQRVNVASEMVPKIVSHVLTHSH